MKRKSGILLPVFSLPSDYGIGSFSKEAYQWIDFLADAGQHFWQTLPLGPTGYGDSPYQSFSTFAGNPYFIDLEEFIEEGWLSKDAVKSVDVGTMGSKIDYHKIYQTRFALLRQAFNQSPYAWGEYSDAFQNFCEENRAWLDDYCLYSALKDHFEGISFMEWPETIRLRHKETLNHLVPVLEKDINFYAFIQYYFSKQWLKLKAYANSKSIVIIGDLPIYVALDSADTWANPDLFLLDKKGQPLEVAGCPPDAFSEDGQLWGNPLYDWPYHQRSHFGWWKARLEKAFELYDVLRIDHFRGFDAYWSVPYGEKTAKNGQWNPGPGMSFIEFLKENFPDQKIIAEDLGFLTPSVRNLLKKSGFPGMKVLQFAFDSREESDYLPHNYSRNCVVYTGTHDNDTTAGWCRHLKRSDWDFCCEYLHIRPGEKHPTEIIVSAAMGSVADTCIIPLQDYLELGTEARINTPSTVGDNWTWRMRKEMIGEDLAKKIYRMTSMYGRL